jgi:hypothetical protein
VTGEDWEAYGAALANHKRALVEGLPDHRELVAHVRGDAAETRAPGARATSTVPDGLPPGLGGA